MEPTEIQEFSRQMKEAGEAASTRIALAISILAVFVAMVTVLSHRSHTQAVLMQSRANDAWESYQSRKLRAENLQVAVDLLTLQPVVDASTTGKRVEEYNGRITKWTNELAGDQDKARTLETEVEREEAKAGKFDLGEALLQIAVVLSSITLLTRTKSYFVLGLALGAAGLAVAVLGLLIH